MNEIATADKLTQTVLDLGIVTPRELHAAINELGRKGEDLEAVTQALVRKGLLTNYQLEKLKLGHRGGYLYGDYKVLYLVGAGTFARVFRAVHLHTGEMFAVKVLRSSKSAEGRSAEWFRREGELGAKLKHPNIVAIHEVYSHGTVHYIVMDFIEGQNLREAFKVRKRFKWEEAIHIITGVLSGLQYAFNLGVTHRDLKMSNVLLSSDGEAKVIDFGLAALDNVAGDEGADRTVEYAALEKATGVRKDDTRSDVFFAGYILHQMLTGVSTLPSGKERAKGLSRDVFRGIKPVRELAPDVPAPIAMVVSKALEMDPERRHQTPGDMLTELKIALRRTKSAADASAKTELASREGIDEDGNPRRLLIVEPDTKRQDLLRDLFKKHGYRVLVTSDPERANRRLVDDPTAAQVVLLGTMSLGRGAVDFFNQLGADAFSRSLPMVLLLDKPHTAWEADANTAPHRLAVRMPIKSGQLRAAVVKVLDEVPQK